MSFLSARRVKMRAALTLAATLCFFLFTPADSFQPSPIKTRPVWLAAYRPRIRPNSSGEKYGFTGSRHVGRSEAGLPLKDDKNFTRGGRFAVLTEQITRIYYYFARRWWILKKAIRAKTEKFTVYVLECENNKYYVGSTSHKRQRFKQHWAKRGGSKWTRQHKPLRIARQYNRVPEAYYLGLEAKVTAECMLEFGVNNVRGAMFAQPQTLTLDDLDALTGFLGHYNDLNYKEVSLTLRRTLPVAPVKDVPKKTKKKKKKTKRAFIEHDRCNLCGQRGHWAAECQSFRCYACGEVGHYAADCPDRSQ